MAVRIWRAACGGALAVWFCCCGCAASRSGPVRLRPDRALAQQFNEEGLRHMADGELDAALAAFRRAVDADPYSGPAHCNLGVALLLKGQPFDGGWELRNACRLMPKAAQPRANLALLYESVGKYGQAEEELRAALALAPEDVEIIGQLARLRVRTGRYDDQTVAWLQTVAEQDDDAVWRAWAQRQLIGNNVRSAKE